MLRTSISQRQGALPLLEVAGLLMILVAIILFVTQMSAFSQERQRMPQGLTLGGVPVNGLSRGEAQAYVEQVYGSPVTVMYGDQEIRLDPAQVSFYVDSEAMLSRAEDQRTEGTFWSGFWDFLWRRPERGANIDLIATYSKEQLRAWLADIAARYDRPPQAAQAALDTMSFVPGQPGYTLDIEASLQRIEEALMRPVNRTVDLVITEQAAPSPDMSTLQALMVDFIVSQKFDGVTSVYAIDLEKGDSLHFELDTRQGKTEFLTCDVAYAALSTMKIPIMVEFFRYLAWEPYPYELDMVESAMILSSNLNANFMLRDIGGGDARRGAQIVTEMVQHLGLENSFIVAPYDEEAPPEYYSTPAREAARAGTCVDTQADPYMQTTVSDLALLLDMIYQCAEFGGGLIAAYPEDFTQAECQRMLEIMSRNEEGRLILSGVPESVSVAHKHGYTRDTIGDAAIVFSPGADYALVIFLWAETDWLNANIVWPIMNGLSIATFNYFNPDMIDEPRRGMPDFVTTGG